jgi:quinol monooxygenase YgiN
MSKSNTQLTVVAVLRAKEGRSEELGRRLLAVVEPTRKEPGNINYDLHQSNDDQNVWMVYENWKSPAALDDHFATPHLQDLRTHLPEILEGSTDIQRFTMTTTVAHAL